MNGSDRVLRALKESIDVALATTEINVVVMGPSLTEDSPAGILRRRIIEEARHYGATVQAEHREAIEISSQSFGEGHTLSHFELHLVKISQLVVILPASPGSLCELGFFSMRPDLGPRMIILVDDSHPRSNTYVSDGPLKAAGHHHAEVHHIDYRDFEAAWKPIKARIEQKRAEISVSRLG